MGTADSWERNLKLARLIPANLSDATFQLSILFPSSVPTWRGAYRRVCVQYERKNDQERLELWASCQQHAPVHNTTKHTPCLVRQYNSSVMYLVPRTQSDFHRLRLSDYIIAKTITDITFHQLPFAHHSAFGVSVHFNVARACIFLFPCFWIVFSVSVSTIDTSWSDLLLLLPLNVSPPRDYYGSLQICYHFRYVWCSRCLK